MPRVAALAELLCSLFTTAELRIWLSRRDRTEALGRTVDWAGSAVVVGDRVAAALDQGRLADREFFDDLKAHLPGRAGDVEAIAEEWLKVASVGPVRILHLSDLHARARTDWDARPLLARLVDAVKKQVAEGLAPDLVVLTGDVAHGGKEAEYRLAEAWLRDHLLPATRLGPDALLVVPGNHDVDRDACGSVMLQALEQALYQGDQDRVAAVLGDKAQARLIRERYKSYLRFLKRLGVPHAAEPYWKLRREVRGVGVHFCGLDTAWLASKDGVQGRLVLGLAQVNVVLPTLSAGDPDLVVALAHHPIADLVDWDRRVVQPPLRARAHLLLRGHLHDPDYTVTQTPAQRLIELPAGAAYAGHAWPMSFQLIELDPAAGKVRAHLRTWSAEWDAWVPDRNRLPPHGSVEFDLR